MSILTESQGNIVTLSTLSVPLISTNIILEITGKIVIHTRKRTSPNMTTVQLELLIFVFTNVSVSYTIPLHFSPLYRSDITSSSLCSLAFVQATSA